MRFDHDVVFCDSCLGGSTVAARLAASRTGLRAFYLADYAVNPLGTRSAPEVRAALERWHDVARARAGTLVIACNTASVLYAESHHAFDRAPGGELHVWSMVDLLEALLASARRCIEGKRICLMGTRFTVSHALYRDRLLRAGALEVVPLAATRTECVVANLRHTQHEGQREVAEEIGDAIRSCDAVLLGCTCFPLAADVIRRINPRCVLLDPAVAIDDVLPASRGGGANRLTIAVSGAALSSREVAGVAGTLFPGWVVDEVVETAAPLPT
jgi:glutamate racemase